MRKVIGVTRRNPLLFISPSVAAVLLLVILCAVALFGVVGGANPEEQQGCGAPAAGAVTPVTGGAGGLTDEQLQNARTVVGTVLADGGGRAGARVALVVVYTEATLVSVNYGDYNSSGAMTTSRGLYQQMDPWGPLEVRLDPAGATRLFLHGGQGGQEGLYSMPNWWTADPWVAAQGVEKSQFSDGSNYHGNLAITDAILAELLAGQTVSDLPSAEVMAGSTPPAPADQVVGAPKPNAAAACAPAGSAPGAANPATGLQQNASQDPSTFGWQHNGPMEPLVWNGQQIGQVAAGTVGVWTGLLNELVPQIPGGLNSYVGCYEDRNNVNSPGRLSFHAYGLACDLSYDRNPNGANCSALSGEYVIPPAAAIAAAEHWGMEWGGTWGFPDCMHFELHLSPDQVRSLAPAA